MGTRYEPVTYWLTMGNQVVRSQLDKRWVQIRAFLTGESPDGLLFRVSSIDRDPDSAFAMQQKFVADMMSAVSAESRRETKRRCLPRDDAETANAVSRNRRPCYGARVCFAGSALALGADAGALGFFADFRATAGAALALLAASCFWPPGAVAVAVLGPLASVKRPRRRSPPLPGTSRFAD